MGLWDSICDGVSDAGSWAYDNAASIGDAALDVAGFIPGVNVVTEAGQALYHGGAGLYDLATGEDGAATELGKAAFHGGMSALNFFTGEGGEAVEAGADVLEVGAELGETGLEAGGDVVGMLGGELGEAGAVGGPEAASRFTELLGGVGPTTEGAFNVAAEAGELGGEGGGFLSRMLGMGEGVEGLLGKATSSLLQPMQGAFTGLTGVATTGVKGVEGLKTMFEVGESVKDAFAGEGADEKN